MSILTPQEHYESFTDADLSLLHAGWTRRAEELAKHEPGSRRQVVTAAIQDAIAGEIKRRRAEQADPDLAELSDDELREEYEAYRLNPADDNAEENLARYRAELARREAR